MSAPTTVATTRRRNLRSWIATFATEAAAAGALDMSPSQLSQIAGPHPTRNIGTTMARRIEAAIGKPEGWLDTPREPEARDPELDRLLLRARHLANEGQLNDQQLAAVRNVLALVTETPPSPYAATAPAHPAVSPASRIRKSRTTS